MSSRARRSIPTAVLAALVASLGLAGCNAILGLDERAPLTGGGAGGAVTTGAGGTSSGGGPAGGSAGSTSSGGTSPGGGGSGGAAAAGGEGGAGASGGSTTVGNLFEGDPHVVALYEFDSEDTITVDELGDNTLEMFGAVDGSTAGCPQGEGCALFGPSTGWLERADVDLSSNFPFKMGTTNDAFSVCFWVEPHSIGSQQTMVAKYNWSDGDYRSWNAALQSTGEPLLWKGYTAGTLYETIQFTTPLTADRWYHVGVTYSEESGQTRIRVWDQQAQSQLANDRLSTSIQSTSYLDVPFSIGAQWQGGTRFSGRLDEVVIFDRVLTTDEIDAIRDGTYGT